MKSIRIAVLIAAWISTLHLIAQNSPGGIVEGVVIDAVTGAGIGGASVTLLGNSSAKHQTKSDVAGHFKIAGVTPGDYRASAEKDGFWPPPSDGEVLRGFGIRIVAGSDPARAELKLAPFNTLRGRVLAPDGKPVAGAEVRLNPNVMANEALTDQQGGFALENTRPGSYTLVAQPPANAQPEEVDGARTAMVTTYYPSTAEKSLAEPIVFLGQTDFGGFEIRMQTASVYSVRGVVLDEKGKPAIGADLALFSMTEDAPTPMLLSARKGGPSFFGLGIRRAPSGTSEANAVTGDSGHFEFPALRTGKWRINAVSNGSVFPRGLADVPVGGSDVDDLQIRLATPFDFAGTIEWKDQLSAGQPDFNGVVTLVNSDSNEFVRAGFVESGRLLFENILPGQYRAIIKPGLAPQIFLGDYEVTGQSFPVTADGPRPRVVLKTNAGTVRGTVEKGEGSMVVLLPQRFEGVALGQTVVCGAGGSFELNEVSPGDYYIAAFEHEDRLAPSAAMVSLVPSRGASVKVEERSTSSITLSAIAVPR